MAAGSFFLCFRKPASDYDVNRCRHCYGNTFIAFYRRRKAATAEDNRFLQYISPTLTLLIGVFVYNEAFTASHLLAFGWIWAALLLFIVSQLRSN